jgi:ethanolamine utilization protein EutL
MPGLVDLWPQLLSCRQVDQVEGQLGKALGLDPERHRGIGLVTCDQDDSLYVCLDHCTRFAPVEVKYGRSFYAGSRHASGPFSGEVLGIVAGGDPDAVAEALWARREQLRVVRFQQFPGERQPAFLGHVVTQTGSYLSAEAGIARGEPLGYLVAPPAEMVVALDAALKAAPVRLAKWMPPPTETNFAGAYLAGELHALEAARDAFVEAVGEFATHPLAAARRPARMRR